MHGPVAVVFEALLHKYIVEGGSRALLLSWNERDGSYGHMDLAHHLRPDGLLMQLSNQFLQGECFPADSSAPKQLEAFAIQSADGHRSVLLINRGAAPVSVTLALPSSWTEIRIVADHFATTSHAIGDAPPVLSLDACQVVLCTCGPAEAGKPWFTHSDGSSPGGAGSSRKFLTPSPGFPVPQASLFTVDQPRGGDRNSAMPLANPVSMRDIARAAGVSVSAVSLALKNSPKISPERRASILTLAEKLGYRRDPRITELMEHLRTARPHRAASKIAFVVPELTRPQFADYHPVRDLAEGVQEMAAVAGFGCDLFYLSDPGMSLRRARDIIIARGIKGIVLAPCVSGVARLDFDCTDLCVATAGYSIVEPRLHRACPNYLQMMDELLADCAARGYRRVGLVMTYGEGGIGHKLFTSSFLYYQSTIRLEDHIPILPKTSIDPPGLRAWFDAHRPDVVISAGNVFEMLLQIGLRVPRDVAFASIDLSQPPGDAAGADHRYNLVGREALKQVLTLLNLNLTGVPENPKVVLVDSHRREGFSLPSKIGGAAPAIRRRRSTGSAANPVPAFRGFLD